MESDRIEDLIDGWETFIKSVEYKQFEQRMKELISLVDHELRYSNSITGETSLLKIGVKRGLMDHWSVPQEILGQLRKILAERNSHQRESAPREEEQDFLKLD